MTSQPTDSGLYQPRRFNKVTKQRFMRRRRLDLIAHVGGSPSQAQLILIARVCRNEWDLRRLDARMDEQDLSEHAMRARLAMENRLRLDLRDLGHKAATKPVQSLAAYIASKAAE